MNHERIEFNSIANMYETNRYEDAANAFEAFITEYGLTHEEITIFYNTFKRLSERYRENLRNIEEMLINFQGETKFEFLSDLQKYGLIEAESYSLLAVVRTVIHLYILYIKLTVLEIGKLFIAK